MSDPYAPVAEMIRAIFEPLERHKNSPPLQKNQNRAVFGTELAVWCVYVFDIFGHAAQQFAPWVRIAWLCVAALSLLLIAVGVSKARGPFDIMGAFWMALTAGLCGYLLHIHWLLWIAAYDPPWGWLGALILKGIYLSTAAGALMKFFLSVRGLSGNAREVVTKDIADNEFTWE